MEDSWNMEYLFAYFLILLVMKRMNTILYSNSSLRVYI